MNCTCGRAWGSTLPPPPCPVHGQASRLQVGDRPVLPYRPVTWPHAAPPTIIVLPVVIIKEVK